MQTKNETPTIQPRLRAFQERWRFKFLRYFAPRTAEDVDRQACARYPACRCTYVRNGTVLGNRNPYNVVLCMDRAFSQSEFPALLRRLYEFVAFEDSISTVGSNRRFSSRRHRYRGTSAPPSPSPASSSPPPIRQPVSGRSHDLLLCRVSN